MKDFAWDWYPNSYLGDLGDGLQTGLVKDFAWVWYLNSYLGDLGVASKQAWCRTLLRLVSKLLLRGLGGWPPNRLGEGLCLGLVSKLLLRGLGGGIQTGLV